MVPDRRSSLPRWLNVEQEWIMFTAKHIYMYKALGWTPPTFGHLGLLMDASGEKLSKRTAGIDLGSFRDMGILPRALVNHVALLGWSHTADSDVMSLDDLVERVSLWPVLASDRGSGRGRAQSLTM